MVAIRIRKIVWFIRYDEYRVSSIVNYLFREKRSRLIAKVLNHYLKKKRCIFIGKDALIGKGIVFPHPHNIILGRYAVVGCNCRIYHDVTIGQNRGSYPELGNNVIVYPGAKIIGKVKVEDYAIIGANAVVTKDVPPNAIVAGIPAKIIGYRSDGDEFY